MTDPALALVSVDHHEHTGLVEAEVVKRTRAYVEASKAKNTRRTYGSAWRSFCSWCRARGLIELPAHPETVATYLADRAATLRPSSLNVHVSAISQAHKLAGVESPTTHEGVRAVVQGIRRTHGTASTPKDAITLNDLRAMLAVAGDDLRGKRDRAMLLVGFCGGLRRSELVGVNVGDLSFRNEGIALRIRRSKTDQQGVGRTIPLGFGASSATCPVLAVRQWVAAAGIDRGPLLRAVDRHGHVRPTRLDGRTVARVVKRLGSAIGLDVGKLGGHSLRAGLATSAAAAGISERTISEITGHRSMLVLRGYIRSGRLFEHDLVSRLGL
jgi:site-specific recombinase XerD